MKQKTALEKDMEIIGWLQDIQNKLTHREIERIHMRHVRQLSDAFIERHFNPCPECEPEESEITSEE